MFSSLPSASKIYVQSCKTKHKTINSAKKKRKKSAATICTPVHVFEEETLVSSTSLPNYSTSELSLTSHEECTKKEVKCNSDKESVNASSDDFDETNESSSNTKYDNVIKDVHIKEMDKKEHTMYVISKSSQSVMNDDEISNFTGEEGLKAMTNVTADSIYCDEFAASDNYRTEKSPKEIDSHLLQAENKSQISGFKPNENLNGECDKESERITSLFPQIELEEISDKEEYVLSKTEEENTFNVTFFKDSDHENCQSNIDDLTSTTLVSEIIDCGNNEALSSSHRSLKESSKDSLKIVSDIDSSSVRSDCCQSSNIYDIHVISSEHSSVDENQISGGEDCRIQSPEQSEKSCTESIMYDSRSVCQNESLYQQSLITEEFCKKHSITESSHENISSTKKLTESISNSSCNFTNFEVFKANDVIKRTLSLPERLCNFKNTDIIVDQIYLDSFSNSDKSNIPHSRFCYTSDKSTFTVNENVSESNEETISHYLNKKDVATTPFKNENLKPITENKSVATSLKDSTKLLLKVLPPVAVLQARARSYVFGSIGPTGSLLGNEELSRYFPDNKVSIFVGTWNMNGHDPPDSIDDFLLPLHISSVPDIYAIGIQESMQSRSEWEILLQTTLGPSHVLFSSTSFGVLHLSIFMRRDLIWFCSEPEEANVAVRPGSMIKTKGAVAICFMFFGTSFLFVNSHLTAHEQKLRERLSDYEKICASLDLPKQIPLKPSQKGKDVTSRFDCVFWSGDLNFRVVQDRSSVLSYVEEKVRRQSSCNSLTEHDQLTQAMAKGMAFHGFSEGVINFVPSYKFDIGTSFFDSTKQRVPSYTDRILYRCKDKSSIDCLYYNAVHEIFTSDHKPVYGVFNVSIKPGRDNIPLSCGLFKRDIYLEAIKRRAQQLEVARNHKQSTICSIM